jgi:proteasome lid subunit RPN8/RPN11
MTGAIRFTPLPNDRVRPDPLTVAAAHGISLVSDRPVYAWPRIVWDQIEKHAGSSRKEVAGLLAGRVWTDEAGLAFVSVEAAIPADWGVDTSATHVSFHPEAWDRLGPQLQSLPNKPVVVGWYHSHPGLTAFFSGTDRDTQAGAFREAWQIGVVVDPVGGERQAYRGPRSEPVDWADIVATETPITEEGPATKVPSAIRAKVAAERPGLVTGPLARSRVIAVAVAAGAGGVGLVALAVARAVRSGRRRRTP